jgi:hypothetical protein
MPFGFLSEWAFSFTGIPNVVSEGLLEFLDVGESPRSLRDQTSSPSARMSRTPPVPGTARVRQCRAGPCRASKAAGVRSPLSNGLCVERIGELTELVELVNALSSS